MAEVLSKDLVTAMGLCLRIKGNVGPVTWRRFNKRKHIAYRERRRTSALTEKQKAHRVRFLRAYEQWQSLTDTQRDDWRTTADRISSRMIGSHLFMRIWWRQDKHFLDQIELWYHVTLVLPGP